MQDLDIAFVAEIFILKPAFNDEEIHTIRHALSFFILPVPPEMEAVRFKQQLAPASIDLDVELVEAVIDIIRIGLEIIILRVVVRGEHIRDDLVELPVNGRKY